MSVVCPNYFHWHIVINERRQVMKEYVAPEMKALAFVAEEAISNDGSNTYNDAEFGGW